MYSLHDSFTTSINKATTSKRLSSKIQLKLLASLGLRDTYIFVCRCGFPRNDSPTNHPEKCSLTPVLERIEIDHV